MAGLPRSVLAQLDPHGRMELIEPGERPGTGACVDFRRLDLAGVSSQPLVRACGKKGALVDATAGLGGDAWILAAAGFSVTCIERSPLVAAVLDDGISRALLDSALALVASRIVLRVGDSAQLLGVVLDPAARSEATAYLDPMYPHQSGSALAPKPIVLVRKAVGEDADSQSLFAAAINARYKRIVVKRPHHAPPIHPEPHHVIEGKLARFDVYCLGGSAGLPRPGPE
ncbi:MAG: rRNA methyltransferase [Phycisphaerales bacterium]|nr:rRNA methyltransferase [Phycisphaerales bacterium]